MSKQFKTTDFEDDSQTWTVSSCGRYIHSPATERFYEAQVKKSAEGGYRWRCRDDCHPCGWSEWRRVDLLEDPQIPDAWKALMEPEILQTPPTVLDVKSPTAADFLNAALGHMVDRAATYDKPQGERSMGNCVQAFNQLTGHQLTEEQGWLFMAVLKITRTQQGKYRADNYEDLAAYAGLAGEAAAKDRA